MIDSKLLLIIVVAAVALARPAVVVCQGNSIEKARHHMELGQEAFDREEFELAADEFTKAYIASPFAAFLYNAGIAFEKSGDIARAVERYRQYLKASPDAADVVQIEMKIQQLQSSTGSQPLEEVKITEVEMKSLISVRTNPKDATVRVLDASGEPILDTGDRSGRTVTRGKYTVEASHPDFRTVRTELNVTPGQVYIVVVEMSQGAFLGFLHVVSDVPGAVVYLDNRDEGPVGHTPFGNALTAGKHLLWVEKPGYETEKREFEMNMGEENRIEIEMNRLSFGTLLVKANVPQSTVYVDDVPVGNAPLEEQLPPGVHRLRVTADGMKDYESRFEISGGQQTKILVRMNPRPSRTSAWVSLGAAVLLFTGGGIAGGQALRMDRELEDAQRAGRLSNDDPRILKGFLWALGSDLTFGVGAVVSGLTVYYFLRDPLPPSEGKTFDPTDFEVNPRGNEGASSIGEPEPETASQTENASRPAFHLAPILSPSVAGLGIAVVF